MKTIIALIIILLLVTFRTQSQDGITLHLEGKWPYGANSTMAISDTIGFYPCGEVLITLSLADPSNPSILKQELFHELVTDVMVSDDLLFVAYHHKISIRAFNGSPNSMQLSNLELTGRIFNMARIRNLLFVIESTKLTLFDLSEPENPVFLSAVETDATIRNMSFNGSFAYASTYDNWVAIFDFSDSLDIQLHPYSLEENSYISYVAYRDSLLYVGASRKDSILVYTLEDPLVPFKVSASFARGPYGIKFYNDLGIISAYGYGILLYDFSDPLNPAYVTKFSKWSEEIHLSPPYFYNQNDAGKIDVYDLSDISTISQVGSFVFGSANYGCDGSGDYVFVAQAQRGVAIIDVRDVQSPFEAGLISIDNDFLSTVNIINNYCFIGGYRLYVYDISDPLSPVLRAEYSNNNRNYQIVVDDSYVYLNQKRDGVQILDIADITNPIEAGSFTDMVEVDVMRLVDNTLYLSDDDERLLILDVTDKYNPILIDSLEINRITGMVHENEFLYLSRSSTGFTILDITNPFAPDSLYTFSYAYAYDVDVRQDTLYLLDRNSGPKVFNVSDKSQAVLIGSYYYKGSLNSVLLQDDYLYMLDSERGLQILSIESEEIVGLNTEQVKENIVWTYPNPAQSRCTLKLTSFPEKNSNLTLCDVNGRKVLMRPWPNSNLRYEISIETFTAGLYFLEIGNKSNKIKGKILIVN